MASRTSLLFACLVFPTLEDAARVGSESLDEHGGPAFARFVGKVVVTLRRKFMFA